MSLKIRLARGGAKKRPFYRVVVADSRMPRDGRFIEKLGTFDPVKPKDAADRLVLDTEKAKAWIAKGAQPTDRVARLLDGLGVVKREAQNNPEKAQPKKKAQERAAAAAAKAGAGQRRSPCGLTMPDKSSLPPHAQDLVLVGRIGAAHGIRGEVRLVSFTEDPKAVADHGPLSDASGARHFQIAALRSMKGNLFIARFTGVATRDAAEALNNLDLYVPRATLPVAGDEEFYHADLIGLTAVDSAGAEIGRVLNVLNFGGGDILEIAPVERRRNVAAAVHESLRADDRYCAKAARRHSAGGSRSTAGSGRRRNLRPSS